MQPPPKLLPLLSAKELALLIQECDVLIHLAGVNRTTNEKAFDLINYGLTKKILDLLQKYNINTKYPHMRQDEILELPYEERSFESLLISLEE